MDTSKSRSSLEFYDLFETRLVSFDDIGGFAGLSKDFYSFSYYFVNFLNYFTGWRNLIQLFLKFNGLSLAAVRARLSRISQIESCLLFLVRFQYSINQNY